MSDPPAALELKVALQLRGVSIRLDGDGLYVWPRSLLSPADVDTLRAAKPELLRLLRVERAIGCWFTHGAPPFDLGESCGDGLVTWWPLHLRKHPHELETFERLLGVGVPECREPPP